MKFITPYPRLVLAGLSGGSGKTIVSLGICRAAVDAGLKVRPFKKGPDYIDAHWLSLAARASTSNLDPFLFSSERILSLFQMRMKAYDVAVIEGNRGLFDGKDVDGSCSTAELARVLRAPVVLIVNCTKVTRTMAAIVMGCQMFEKDLDLQGVILNRTAGTRHENILRDSIEKYTDLKVFGSLPKLLHNPIPERHMGLISDQEFEQTEQAFADLSQFVRDNLDMQALFETADSAYTFSCPPQQIFPQANISTDSVTIGYVNDAALCFYYPENLEALRAAGARLVELSLLHQDDWPAIDGLYLGGGFPETQAHRLAENNVIRERVLTLSKNGLPIYAECGGFMYLCRDLIYDGVTYPMAGVFPVVTTFFPKPQGLGYVQGTVQSKNPFYAQGTCIHGHEFHYSCSGSSNKTVLLCLKLDRGQGVCEHMDFLLSNNTLAGYTHMHALSHPEWALHFVSAALRYKHSQQTEISPCPDIRI
ncbi:MAG: cobyrinate a,c-diamide synthase [Desulfoplanes sp.]